MKLLCIPAHDLSKLFWDGACLRASHPFKHLTVAIALDKLDWNTELQQACKCLTWHRARKHIASDHYMFYPCLTNIMQDSLKCGEVAVNIIDCSDPHNRPCSLSREMISRRTCDHAGNFDGYSAC